MSSIDSFFESVKLPSIPDLAHSLIQTLNDEDASLDEVGDLITRDPAISAKLLRLANSAQFGLPRGVGTIEDAIAMVGMNKVRTLALGACLSGSFPVVAGLDTHSFWKTSMACAGYSEWLARKVGVDAQTAWLTGMMLRLGELLIAQAQPQALLEIEQLPAPPGTRWQREKKLIGYTEGELTAELARRWNFPMQMVQALQRSADPLVEQAYSRLGAIIHLAGLLADTPNAGPEQVPDLPSDVLANLGLGLDWMQDHFPSNADFIDAA
ncbi:histidine kinase [Rhodoferax lacus]|uniref:Histidine kinase n=1 Tax=Rhodoferax lacus TaxID=2184758 RepID=A0A3E1R816_9BURK|nr:HDOD domain-containing protein [Rhodoferax lacus]RFO95182.1 histidine kinase [Rhodoferax lacus]